MPVYYYSIDEKQEDVDYRHEFETIRTIDDEWDKCLLAEDIVEHYERDGDYLTGPNVDVYIWDKDNNFIGKFNVSMEIQRTYYAYKVKDEG